MKYASVCSGISSESVAWRPQLKWSPAWFSEIAPFPSTVLAHHYPDVLNLGDANKIHEKPEFSNHKIDILVAGTPCQPFSLQGTRTGVADPSGRLALRFLEIAAMRRPRWLLWENVEAVRCANGGRDFETFLSKLGNIGYGFSWHVLDARDFGLAQSRRRIFLVGHTGGDWQRAAAVFSERDGVPAGAEAGWENAGRGGTGAQDSIATAKVFALQGNAIHRRAEAGRRRALREGLMYCLTVSDKHAVIADGVARYILPVEAERLQGFPDDYTKVPYRGKSAPDQLRYEAVGNAMPVPILVWLGDRIAFVDSLSNERVRDFLPAEDFARTLSDAELVERCVQGFRKLKEIVPYLREARERFAQQGRRVPVAGKPTWSEWVEQNLGVTVRRVNQLLRVPEPEDDDRPREEISRGSRLGRGDWRGLLKSTECKTAQVFGGIEDENDLARAIRKFAQAVADRYIQPHGKLVVRVSVKSRK